MAEGSLPIAQSAGDTSPARPYARTVALALAVLLILAGNLFLRRNLERTPLPSYPIFEEFNVSSPWMVLLPLDWGEATGDPHSQGTVHWGTTGIILIQAVAKFIPLTRLFYLLNAALIVSSFVCSWHMLRSPVFSLTFTICMAFGTQFHWAYVCSPIILLYLFVIYLEANLLCMLKVMQTGQRAWKVGYLGTLVLLALCTEYWLDYVTFLTIGSLFLLLHAWRTGSVEARPRALFVLLGAWGVAVIYLGIRMSLGRQQYQPGNESEMIFTYSSPIMAIEDFISNVISYVYIAISNYFPPVLVGSNSLYHIGADRIVLEQHGYHEAKAELVRMHHVFYWYFAAGIVFAMFGYYLIRNARTAVAENSTPHLYLTMAMLMVLCGFAVHTLVKYRPYLSVPLLTYKCMVSNVGVALLLAYGVAHARKLLPRLVWVLAIAIVWGVIGWSALARPAYLSHLASEVGMGQLPNPRSSTVLPGLLRNAPVESLNR